MKGTCLSRLSQNKEAIKCYDIALTMTPKEANLWYNKGVSLAYLNQDVEALSHLEMAVKINPKLSHAWFNKAFVEEKLERNIDAQESYRKFLELAENKDFMQVTIARMRLFGHGKRAI